MVGYVNNNDPVFGIVTDYVNESLTQFVRELAQELLSGPLTVAVVGPYDSPADLPDSLRQ